MFSTFDIRHSVSLTASTPPKHYEIEVENKERAEEEPNINSTFYYFYFKKKM